MINIHSSVDAEQTRLQREIFTNNAKEALETNGIRKVEHQEAIANCLLALYSSRDRFYHTFVHVNMMFENMHFYFKSLSPSERLAILFHDAIYTPGLSDNEGRSIDFMVMLMAGYGVPITEWCWASRCIKETANFLGEVHDPSTHAVVDLDLSPFAVSYSDFEKQNKLIEREYPDVAVSDRADFLERFLYKERIYYRLEELEDQARENITRYVEQLRDEQTA